MRKTFLTLTVLCFAITMAFGQQRIDVQLSDDHPSHEQLIIYNFSELCRFILEKGETDAIGNTSVFIKLEKADDDYQLLLFNRALDKKALREIGVYFAENLPGGEFVQKVETINVEDFVCIPSEYGTHEYQFPKITVKEGEIYKCVVPIHVAKEKEMFLCGKKKRTIESIQEISIEISVENTDSTYFLLEQQCDSLVTVFNDSIKAHAFCTNKLHKPKFEDQIFVYTDKKDYLKTKINEAKTKWEPGSSKYKMYEDLKSKLDTMDIAIKDYIESKYDCCDKTKHKTVHYCKFCKQSLSLEEIYNLLNNHYMDLLNKDKEKSKEMMQEVETLYKCCSDPTCAKHASNWKKGGITVMNIKKVYKAIKDYKQ